MRKVCFIAFIAIAAITLASFTTISHPPVKHHKTAKKMAPAQPYNFQFTDDLTGFVIYDPCTGENIDLSGTEHAIFHGVYNPNTNTVMDDTHYNLQGVSAVGETTGNSYQITGASNSSQVVSYTDCSVTIDEIVTENFTTAGSNNNFQVKIRYHFTYNYCTGTYTVIKDIFSETCQ